jgi:putative transposase
MAYRQTQFAPDEWYHCYNRGVEKRTVFETKSDYQRFLQSLFLCNDTEPVRRDNIRDKSHTEIFQIEKNESLVSVGAYCLMPNHFHLLLQEKIDGGISQFMQKLGTAYTMYFNIKNERVGGLFVKPFRSKHIHDDRYLQRVTQYIHLNPVELFERNWKTNPPVARRRLATLREQVLKYPYSSLFDYIETNKRPEIGILDPKAVSLLRNDTSSFAETLKDAALYYQSIE